MGHYHYNCDEYCEECLPVDENDPEVDYDYGEQDSPAHCCVCHCPLDYTLTSEGVGYVLSALQDTLTKAKEVRNTVHACYKGTYYEGCRHVEITRDWAKEILGYGLSEEDQAFVEKFLEETEE